MTMDAAKAMPPPPPPPPPPTTATTTTTTSDHHNHRLLPWLWVIELLADSDQVDPSLLHDLISNASQLTTTTHDSFIEALKERIALDKLEEFLSRPTTTSTICSPSSNSAAADAIPKDATLNVESHSNKILINVSDRAQDVLSLILRNMETSNEKMPMLDSLKWDIRQFILHKRAGLPNFGLQQLKSAILEGVEPFASRLRKVTGFGKEDQLVRIPVDGDVPIAAILEASSSKCLKRRNELEKVDQQDHIIPVNDGDPNTAADNRDENIYDLEIQSPKANSCHLGLENGNQLMFEGSCCKELIYVRKVSPEQNHNLCLDDCRRGLETVNNAAESLEKSLKDDQVHSKSAPLALENTNEIVHENPPDSSFFEKEQAHFVGKGAFCGNGDDQQAGPKNFDDNGEFKSLGQNTTSLQGNDPALDPSGRNLSSVVKEVCDLGKGNLVDDGDGYECVALKRDKQGNDSQIQHNLLHCSSDGVIPEEAHLEGHHQNNDNNEAKGDSECRAKPGTSSVYDRNLDKVPNFDSDEEMVIAAEKHRLLSSQNTFNQDSQATAGWTEGNICFKCNEGGQLLTCCVSSCPLAVHERCLGSSFNHSDSGNFHCPSCSYVQALAAYHETKKKAALVKEKVALAKHNLSAYVCVMNAQQVLQPSELAPREEQINSRMVQGSRLRREVINKKPMQGVVSQKEAEAAFQCINSLPTKGHAPTSPFSDRNAAKARGEEDHQKQVLDHENQRVVEDQERAEPCAAHHSGDLPERVEETTLNCENTSNALLSEEREKAVMNEDQPSVSKKSKRVRAHRKGKTAKSSGTYAKTTSIHQEHADVENEIEDWIYTADPHREPSCQRNANADKVAENQDHDEISYASRKRSRFATTQQSNWGRRKTSHWSAEEEEILKEGVFRFASGDGEKVPWKKILEFGSHVFQRSRTFIDLKDKWRNLWSNGGRTRGRKMRSSGGVVKD